MSLTKIEQEALSYVREHAPKNRLGVSAMVATKWGEELNTKLADLERQLQEAQAGAAAMREVLEDGYVLPEFEHAEPCVWISRQECQCGLTEANWYTHFMATLDRALASEAGRSFLERMKNITRERDAVRAEANRVGYRAGLEEAAKVAETFGGHPPSPLGRRAKLAAAIRQLKEKGT